MRESTKEEKQKFLDGIDNYIIKKREEQEGFKLLILGILVGVIGSFVANLFHKISENWSIYSFWITNSVIILIFVLLSIRIINTHNSYSKEIRDFQKNRDKIFKHGLMIDSDKPLFE